MGERSAPASAVPTRAFRRAGRRSRSAATGRDERNQRQDRQIPHKRDSTSIIAQARDHPKANARYLAALPIVVLAMTPIFAVRSEQCKSTVGQSTCACVVPHPLRAFTMHGDHVIASLPLGEPDLDLAPQPCWSSSCRQVETRFDKALVPACGPERLVTVGSSRRPSPLDLFSVTEEPAGWALRGKRREPDDRVGALLYGTRRA
jgi:hypothetical protein